MKSINQYNNSNTIQLSFNDIVFENRNKEYGSYDLRKRYMIGLLYVLVCSLSAITITVVCPMLYYKYFHADSPIVLHQQGPSVMTTVELDPTQVVPPPEIKAPVIAPPSFVPPKVVDNVDNNATEFGPTDIAIETSTNQKPDDNLNNLPPQTAPEDIPDEIPTVTIAEEPAMFRGGELSAFNKWVQQQLVYPQRALDEHIEGRVTVAFNVGPKGIINDIAIVRSVDPLLDNEVIRVLNQSPLWTEPRQGGKVVKQHFFMPVFFKIQE